MQLSGLPTDSRSGLIMGEFFLWKIVSSLMRWHPPNHPQDSSFAATQKGKSNRKMVDKWLSGLAKKDRFQPELCNLFTRAGGSLSHYSSVNNDTNVTEMACKLAICLVLGLLSKHR